jgi:hypothetical protein
LSNKSIIYKNENCAICNGRNLSQLSICPQPQLRSPTHAISLILDLLQLGTRTSFSVTTRLDNSPLSFLTNENFKGIELKCTSIKNNNEITNSNTNEFYIKILGFSVSIACLIFQIGLFMKRWCVNKNSIDLILVNMMSIAVLMTQVTFVLVSTLTKGSYVASRAHENTCLNNQFQTSIKNKGSFFISLIKNCLKVY